MNQSATFNVEDEFAAAISPVGGQRVTEVLGRVPGHENADFMFASAAVVAELKCLDEDKIADERIIEKASQLYVEELNSGRAPVVAFGTVRMSTKGFSEEYTRKVFDLYRVPIERQIKKADSQIAATTHALKMVKPAGLLLVANNNHTALDPWHAGYILNEILTKPQYTNINSAVLFSGNLAAAMPGGSKRVDYWVEINRDSKVPVDQTFLSAVRSAWHSHLERLFGCKAAYQGASDMQTLAKLESR